MPTLCFKYRIFPSQPQTRALNETLEVCRLVYNSMIAWRKQQYEQTGKSPSYFEQKRSLPIWKDDQPRLKDVHAHVLQNVVMRVDLAFKAFFRRVKAGEEPGYPRFKSAGCYDSITYFEWGNGYDLRDGRLRLSKIGHVKIHLHRPLQGTPKTCTIRRYGSKWFVCISCEVESIPLPPSNEAIGIDVGLEKFASMSNGEFVQNPRFFRREEKAIAKAQRKLDACGKKRSKKKQKTQKVVTTIHRRVANKRGDFIHQTSRRLVDRYGTIAVEKLNVENMTARPKPKVDEATGLLLPNGAAAKAGLNKSIQDAVWTQFRFALFNKAANAGRRFIEVDPRYTSQDCSGCGFRPEAEKKKTLKDRWHLCPQCGLSLDRDMNAAVNIIKKAMGLHGEASLGGLEAKPL